MARYRKIDTRIWNDAKFRELSDRGKLVFFFLLTHPHMTSVGAMRATMNGLAAEIGWTEKAFREAFTEGFRKGMCEHDEKACFIGLPNFLKYNRPESPNVIKSWSASFDLIPECLLKVQLHQRVKEFTEGLGEGFRKAFAEIEEGFRKAMPNQEQEQEQEQEQDTPKPPDHFQEVLDAWNTTPGVRRAVELNKERKKHLAARLKAEWPWQKALSKFPLKCFAADPTGWQPEFDWFIRPGTVVSILEGKYDWSKAKPEQSLFPTKNDPAAERHLTQAEIDAKLRRKPDGQQTTIKT